MRVIDRPELPQPVITKKQPTTKNHDRQPPRPPHTRTANHPYHALPQQTHTTTSQPSGPTRQSREHEQPREEGRGSASPSQPSSPRHNRTSRPSMSRTNPARLWLRTGRDSNKNRAASVLKRIHTPDTSSPSNRRHCVTPVSVVTSSGTSAVPPGRTTTSSRPNSADDAEEEKKEEPDSDAGLTRPPAARSPGHQSRTASHPPRAEARSSSRDDYG